MPSYKKVVWHHDHPDEPVLLYSETGDDGYETRKVDLYRDGRQDYADESTSIGTTFLGQEPEPPLEEIAADADFTLFVSGGPRASRLPSPVPRRQNPLMSPVQSLIDDLLLILRSGDHDTSWTRYESVGQLIDELERLRARGDEAAAEVRRLCLPTGVIDEIAISSGWSEAWLRLTTGKHRDVLSPQHG